MYYNEPNTERDLQLIRNGLARLHKEAEQLHSKVYDMNEHCKRFLDESEDAVGDVTSAVRSLSDAMDEIGYAMEDLDILIEE